MDRALPDLADRALRAVLRLPGWLVERVDGPVVVPDGPGPDEVFEEVRRGARHPEAYLALEEDLHYHRDAAGVVAWQHRGRTAFAVGGLNALARGRVALLRGFRRAADAVGVRRHLVFPLRDEELPAARAAGFEPVQVGVEAWLDLECLDWRGGRHAHVRQMVNRARRRGVVVCEIRPEDHAEALAALHARWLDAKRPSWRMKLLVGSPSLERPFDRRYLAAHVGDRLEGFVTLLPGADGVWGLDVMCRRPDAVPGTMESLIHGAAVRLRAEGASQLSLGACPMAGVPLDGPKPVLRRIFRLLHDSAIGNRIFGFRRLHRFKDKFRPRWEPVYFAAAPRLGWFSLYLGCRMWGLY